MKTPVGAERQAAVLGRARSPGGPGLPSGDKGRKGDGSSAPGRGGVLRAKGVLRPEGEEYQDEEEGKGGPGPP